MFKVDESILSPESISRFFLGYDEAPFPDFHNVYIDPESYDHYMETGNFREGTVLVKELVSVGSKAAASGRGYFMGEFIGLEAAVKDSNRFPDEPGNWAYFSFGHSYPLADTAEKFPAAACSSCHEAAAVSPPRRWRQTPEDRLLSTETITMIRKELQSMPPRQAEVVTLRDIEGWSAEEVCQVLGLTEANQKVLLHRGRTKVRNALERYQETDGPAKLRVASEQPCLPRGPRGSRARLAPKPRTADRNSLRNDVRRRSLQ